MKAVTAAAGHLAKRIWSWNGWQKKTQITLYNCGGWSLLTRVLLPVAETTGCYNNSGGDRQIMKSREKLCGRGTFKLSLYRCVEFEWKKKEKWGWGKLGKRMFREEWAVHTLAKKKISWMWLYVADKWLLTVVPFKGIQQLMTRTWALWHKTACYFANEETGTKWIAQGSIKAW